MDKLKSLLIVAYWLNRDLSSDAVAAWAFCMSASQTDVGFDKVIVLTDQNSGLKFQSELRQFEGLKIECVWPENSNYLSVASRGFLVSRFKYLLWFAKSKKMIRSIYEKNLVLIAHHVSPATEILPSPLVFLPSKVYRIYGPIGSKGTLNIWFQPPFHFGSVIEFFKQIFRNFLSSLASLALRFKSDLVLLNSKSNIAFFLRPFQYEYFPNCYVPRIDTSISCHERYFVMVGNFSVAKRFDLAIRIFSEIRSSNDYLAHIGYLTKKQEILLRNVARKYNVEPFINFMGEMTRLNTIDKMINSVGLIHATAKEGASYVVAEAIKLGVPIICHTGTGAYDLAEGFLKNSKKLSIKHFKYFYPISFNEFERNHPHQEFKFDLSRITNYLEKIYKNIV